MNWEEFMTLGLILFLAQVPSLESLGRVVTGKLINSGICIVVNFFSQVILSFFVVMDAMSIKQRKTSRTTKES